MSGLVATEDGQGLPSAGECDARCQQFAQITGTDTALAMFFLQDRAWNLERAVNDFFAETDSSKVGTVSSSLDEPVASLSGSSRPESADKDKASDNPKSPGVEDSEPHRIRLMSWNIDGLDPKNLRSRTLGACHTINKEQPHVVFLQEVVAPSLEVLEEKCPLYIIIPGGDEGYFTAIMLNVMFSELEDQLILPFTSSLMNRNLLIAKCKVKGEQFYFMNSHLESTGEYSAERKNQLKKAFDHMKKVDANRTVIFGGDLNLRDKEVTEVGGIPAGVCDVWTETGERPEAKFTWDTSRNDNLELGGRFKPKCRFDRLYLKYSDKKSVKPVYFELVGLERLSTCQRFASDHWGLLTHFNVVSRLPD